MHSPIHLSVFYFQGRKKREKIIFTTIVLSQFYDSSVVPDIEVALSRFHGFSDNEIKTEEERTELENDVLAQYNKYELEFQCIILPSLFSLLLKNSLVQITIGRNLQHINSGLQVLDPSGHPETSVCVTKVQFYSSKVQFCDFQSGNSAISKKYRSCASPGEQKTPNIGGRVSRRYLIKMNGQ